MNRLPLAPLRSRLIAITPALLLLTGWLLCLHIYWLLVRYGVAINSLPPGINRFSVSLHIMAIDLPVTFALAIAAAAACGAPRFRAFWVVLFAVAMAVVIGLNAANYLMVKATGRSFSFYEISYITDMRFFAGSGVPMLLGLKSAAIVLGPATAFAFLLVLGRRIVRSLPLRTVLLAALILALPANQVRRWGYRGEVRRVYAGSTSLYIDNLLGAFASSLPLSAAESSRLQQQRGLLFDNACTPRDHDLAAIPASGDNIILIILESFTERFLDTRFDGEWVCPNLRVLRGQGLSFPRAFANSHRTSSALLSIYCGELDMVGGRAFLDSWSEIRLPFITDRLRTAGYLNCWFHGNDTNFDRRASIFRNHGFDEVHGPESYPASSCRSAWGICDPDFMTATFTRIDSLADTCKPRPFFATLLTLSGHHPFLPVVPGICFPNPRRVDSVDVINAHHYSDYAIGLFLERFHRARWADRTWLIVTGDHGSPGMALPSGMPGRVDRDTHVPLIIAGPGVPAGVVVQSPCSHIDIAPTILNAAGIDTVCFGIGCSILLARRHNVPLINRFGGMSCFADSDSVCVVPRRMGPAPESERDMWGYYLGRYEELWTRALVNGQTRME